MKKSLVFDTSFQKQLELIGSFEKKVNELRSDAYSQRQSASQSEDRTTGKVELLSTYERELNFVTAEMSFLKSLDPEVVCEKVEPGAIVVTDLRTFFIAVSSEKMDIEGEEIFGISTKAPIYSVMTGLAKGDDFKYGDTAYKIADVY